MDVALVVFSEWIPNGIELPSMEWRHDQLSGMFTFWARVVPWAGSPCCELNRRSQGVMRIALPPNMFMINKEIGCCQGIPGCSLVGWIQKDRRVDLVCFLAV